MKSHITVKFRKAFAELPADVRKEEIIWYWIGSHSDYDKLIKQFKK